MAKLTLNSALTGIRGKLDNWVYRKYGDRMVLGRRPDSTKPPTPAQLAVRERFRAAAAYASNALADPTRLPLYQAFADAKGLPVFAVMLRDYMTAPTVSAIDASGYLGHVGNPIKVMARDDFAVASVQVMIRNATSAVLEQGPAAVVDGWWTYHATTTVAAGSSVTIEAVATDYPGQTGSLSVNQVVA